jgi:hypothetical protein
LFHAHVVLSRSICPDGRLGCGIPSGPGPLLGHFSAAGSSHFT